MQLLPFFFQEEKSRALWFGLFEPTQFSCLASGPECQGPLRSFTPTQMASCTSLSILLQFIIEEKCLSSHFFFLKIMQREKYCPMFTDNVTEAHAGEGTGPGTHKEEWTVQDFKGCTTIPGSFILLLLRVCSFLACEGKTGVAWKIHTRQKLQEPQARSHGHAGLRGLISSHLFCFLYSHGRWAFPT